MFKRRSVNINKIAWLLFFTFLFLISFMETKASLYFSVDNTNSTELDISDKKNGSIFEINKLNFKLQNSSKKEFGIFQKFKFTEISKEEPNSNINLDNHKNIMENEINFISIKNSKEETDQSYNRKVLYKGWLKYMEINEDSKKPPKNFFINKNFFEAENMNNILIPDKFYFYFELTLDKLTIYDNFSEYRKRINDIKIINIGEDTNLNPCKGGIEKIGKFSEGYCFIVKFSKNNKKTLWELCSKNANDANKWIQSLLAAQKENRKILKNNASGLLITHKISLPNTNIPHIHHTLPDQSILSLNNNPINQINKITQISNNQIITETLISEEMWVPIGEWTQCSKPCGGGVQTRKFICKNENKCSGESLRKRQCNIQLCKKDLDEHISNLEKVAQGKWQYLGNWSPCSKKCGIGGFQKIKRICVNGNCIGNEEVSKPCNVIACGNNKKNKKLNDKNNIFNKCKNLIGKFNLLNGEAIIPTIVEVNLKNIEFYRLENREANIVSQDMKPYLIISNSDFISFAKSRRNENCLKLQTNSKVNQKNFGLKKNSQNIIMDKSPKIRLCNTHISKSPIDYRKEFSFCDDWMKRYNEFKKKCSNQILEKTIKDIQKSINTKVNPDSLINKISKKLKGKKGNNNKKKDKLLDLQFEEFKKQAQQVMKKESNYEKSLIEQEKQRLECEDKKLNEEIKKQEIMTKKLLNEIKLEKKTNASYDIKQKIIKREMKNIMNNIDSKISEQRISMLNNLQKLRTEHNIKRKKAVSKLINLKKNLGKAILNNMNGAKGNPKKCFSEQTKQINYRKDYCYKNFAKNKLLMENCVKESQFCYVCCDSEMQMDSKENLKCCYSKCDSISQRNKQCNVFYQNYHIMAEPLKLFD